MPSSESEDSGTVELLHSTTPGETVHIDVVETSMTEDSSDSEGSNEPVSFKIDVTKLMQMHNRPR